MQMIPRAGKLLLFVLAALPLFLSTSGHAYTFTTLYHFNDKSDGGEPVGGVVQDAMGTVYGETYYGGDFSCSAAANGEGCGTVYSVSTTGIFTLLATFDGVNGGHGSVTPVLIGKKIYGATANGGSNNDGVVFCVNTDGSSFTVVHSFIGTDGAVPQALAVGLHNTLYGITRSGGTHNNGALFSITQSGAFTKLHDFSLPVSGNPNTLVVSSNGTLVGSSLYGGSPSSGCHHGCGTIFTFEPDSGQFLTVDTFPSSGAQGLSPYVGSIGPGATVYGGEFYAIFSLNQQSGFVPLANLNSYTVGSGVQSGPAYAPSGILYGVLLGSITATDGLIYSLQNGVITDLYAFAGSLNGASGQDPIAQPIITPTGSLIGTTSQSGYCNSCGTVWEYTP